MRKYLRVSAFLIYGVIALISLTACGGGGGGDLPDFSCMFGCNHPPTANAGRDRNVPTGTTVYLYGTSSSDPDDNITSYNWSFISTPALDYLPNIYYSTSSTAYFVPYLDGVYVVKLVVSDWEYDSSDTVIITAIQYNPIASAGPDANVPTNTTVTIDGSGSYDPNSYPMTYSWTVVSIPSGSTAALSDSTAIQPTFFADVDGIYQFRLVVNDGQADSAPDTVVLTATNFAPVASAGGPYQNVHVGTTISLDGSGSSDANGDSLTFSWSFQTIPPGSTATLSDPSIEQPTFTTDLVGTYTLDLVVNDGVLDSMTDTVSIYAENSRPTSSAGQDQFVDIGSQVFLDGSGSSDIDGDPLSYQWTFAILPPGSSATFSDSTAVNPNFTADIDGTYQIVLTVRDEHNDIDTDYLIVTAPPPKTFGGKAGSSVQQTTDGGYIIAGTTSMGAGGYNMYLVRTDAVGNLLWDKTFGGDHEEKGYSVQQTTDGGYVVAGYTWSMGAGNSDVYLVKTDDMGNLLWEKTFGGTGYEFGYSVQQTTDGGYIITGDIAPLVAMSGAYLIKTDAVGKLLWEKTLGVYGQNAYGRSVQQTTDGGYIIAGRYNHNVYLLRTDATGDLLWEKTFGSPISEGNAVQQTTDGGFVIIGKTDSIGAGNDDVYLIKTDGAGNLLWEKTFGRSSYETGYSVQQTTDGGYVITGKTQSMGVGLYDVYLIKTDSTGNIVSERTFGGFSDDSGSSVQQTTDGEFIIVGQTKSYGDTSGDIYLIKTDGVSTTW